MWWMEGGNINHEEKGKERWDWDTKNTITPTFPTGKFGRFPAVLEGTWAERLLLV